MSDTNGAALPNESPREPTLREIAEAAYDQVEAQDEAREAEATEGAAEEPVALDSQPRDKSGRWVAKEPQPGEAIGKPDPAPKPEVSETRAPTPDPAAAQVRSNQAPEHWSAEDKASFAKLPQEGQAFLLKRHGEMEAEFTRKSQASAGAVQFAQSLVPVFNDQRVMQSLQQMRLNPSQAIHEWAGLHVRMLSPRLEDRFGALIDIAERAGLDPARIFTALNRSPLPAGLNEAELKDPAVKIFADHIGQIRNEHAAFRREVQQYWDVERQNRADQGKAHAMANIDQFAYEAGPDGKPLRPYFDAVVPIILDLYKANPNRDLAEAYDQAIWAHPEIRRQLLADIQMRQQSQHDVQRAKIAARGNARGITAPAVKPPGNSGPSRGTLRDIVEQSAEQVGF
jgi:hypothetical protein